LEKALDLSSRRHELISSNIANSDTPGYRTADINFEAELRRSAEATAAASINTDSRRPMGFSSNTVNPVVYYPELEMKNDENNVDIDREVQNLAKNGFTYSLASKLVGSRFSILGYAIREGR